jgi:hypothetical protein
VLDFLFEFLLQIVFEFVAEVLVEIGFKGAAGLLRSRTGRYATAVVVGLVAGLVWGDYLSTQGVGHRPRLFWVSLSVGGLAAIAALVRASQQRKGGDDALSWATIVGPWRWPAFRLAGFSVLNLAVALGIAVGYHPHVPG